MLVPMFLFLAAGLGAGCYSVTNAPSPGWCEATIQLSVKDIFTSGSSSLWIPAIQSRERANKGARQLLYCHCRLWPGIVQLWLVCHRSSRYKLGTYMYVAVNSEGEWHQFQGLNVVIHSQYRQRCRASGGLKTRARSREAT